MAETGDLDWDDLRYFLRATQAKTLAGAARAMRVEHTTVGRRLSALERSIGAPLVLRGPDGLQLTPLGEQALPLVEEVERAVAKVRALVATQKSRVRLAAPSGFTRFFTEGLPRLREKHPELSLEIISGSRPVDLKKGEADIALRSGRVADDDLVARKLAVSGWSLYASDAYLARKPGPIDPDDLSGHDIIGYDASLSGVPAAKWIEERATKARIVLRSREMTDMLAAATSGAGLAVLPCSLAEGEPTLRRLTPKVVATRDIFLVYPREARLSAEVRAVIQFVTDVMREHADRLSGATRE